MVPSLRVICASTMRQFGDKLRIDDLPHECKVLLEYLPEIVKPVGPQTTIAVVDNITASESTKSNGRVSPVWMQNRAPCPVQVNTLMLQMT